jgi:NAD(P)-dependent dehydrogenase (short-subunit alcohol dehydrogenase family)
MGRMSGKVALVTGAAGGIGRATARRFVEEGATVWLTDLDGGVLSDVAASLGAAVCGWSAGDVSDERTALAAVDGCVARFGGVDVLFANAGTEGRVGPLTSLAVEDFTKVLAINVIGPWLFIKHAAPEIARRGGGSIVCTSSIAGLIGSAGMAPYIASKHAVIGLVKTAALELAPMGIRVNAINPGPIDNRMMRSIEGQAAPGAAEQVKAGFTAMVPLRRYGTNEEIANLALFLASDESSYSTGACFLADGGFVVG